MFGFLIGTACLLGLVAVLASGRRRYAHGRWGCGGPRGRYFFLNAVLERLDTSPGQEKVIRAAVDELSNEAQAARRELSASRRDVAQSLSGPSFDEAGFREISARYSAAFERLRDASTRTLARIHESLDDRQRKLLAEIVESGPGWGWGFGHRYGH